MVSPNFKTAGQPHRHHLYLSSQGFTPEHISAHLLKGSVKLKERSMGKSWETHGFFCQKMEVSRKIIDGFSSHI
jgi:hypothetical protein